MCGRFALYASAERLAGQFRLPLPFQIAPRYNIAPSQPVLALHVLRETNTREWTHFQWGLVPRWAQDPKIGQRMINARAETLAEKPAFRNALRYRRCIIPADGFYEWKKQGNTKQPYFVRHREGKLLALAGLWEHWQGADGSELQTCTIITTEPNAVVRPLHDRMAVILPEEAYDLWLDPAMQQPDRLLALLRPAPDEALIAYPVSPRVNNPANDDPRLIEPIR
ncbi:Putative SOS response-associated peptidase YedK [bacterium HR15]|nr:Putative SOS response-associated peptidase YedK [bacterium HR15]